MCVGVGVDVSVGSVGVGVGSVDLGMGYVCALGFMFGAGGCVGGVWVYI